LKLIIVVKSFPNFLALEILLLAKLVELTTAELVVEFALEIWF